MNYNKGGRKKNFKNQATGEYGNTARTALPMGSTELRQLSKGITESHKVEENKLFNTKYEIDKLLEGLIKTEKKDHEAQ